MNIQLCKLDNSNFTSPYCPYTSLSSTGHRLSTLFVGWSPASSSGDRFAVVWDRPIMPCRNGLAGHPDACPDSLWAFVLISKVHAFELPYKDYLAYEEVHFCHSHVKYGMTLVSCVKPACFATWITVFMSVQGANCIFNWQPNTHNERSGLRNSYHQDVCMGETFFSSGRWNQKVCFMN